MSNKKIICVNNVSKKFKVYVKKPGLRNSIKGLIKREYKEKYANSEISFEIEEGDFIGLIGPNGAGKTTLIKMMTGIIHPTEGEIRMFDENLEKLSNKLKSQYSLVMGQKSQLWWDLPAYDTLLLNRAIYDVSDEEFDRKIDYFEKIFDLKEIMHVPVRQLSLGERMKMEIVSCLLHNPKILFLDEPTIGLDVVAQRIIREFLADVNTKLHITIILTSHNMEDITNLCKKIIIINNGKKVFDGNLEHLLDAYCNSKIVSITFENKINVELDNVEWIKKEPYTISFRVKKEELGRKMFEVLNKYEVVDISIEGESIATIIEKIYNMGGELNEKIC